MAKNAIGLAIATEEYGSKFFVNGASPSSVLEHPGVLKDQIPPVSALAGLFRASQ